MHYNTEEEQRVLLMLPPEHAQAAVEHAQALDEAATIMLNRTLSYGTVWQRFGAVSNLLNAARKVERLMVVWYDGQESYDLLGDDGKVVRRIPALHKDALDDAFDAINYLAFFIQNARQGNITGDRRMHDALDRERTEAIQRIREIASVVEDGFARKADELYKIADILESKRSDV